MPKRAAFRKSRPGKTDKRRSNAVSITRMMLPFTDIAAMHEDERAAFILIGHALNEINALRRVGIGMANEITESNAELAAIQTGQAMVIMRLWLGKLFETWELFRHRIQARPFSRKIIENMSLDAVNARDAINRILATPRFSRIRNEFAFHAPSSAELETAFRNIQVEPLQVYVSDIVANTFYQACETIVTLAMIPGEAGEDVCDNFLSLINDSVSASEYMVMFLGEYWACLVSLYCPGVTRSVAFRIERPKRIDDLRIPAIVAGSPPPR